MSQTSFLEDVESWDQETCKQKLCEVLPRLISMYKNGCSGKDKVNILGIMVNSFLPFIKISDVEQQFFSTVLPATTDICHSTVKLIHDAVMAKAENRTVAHEEIQGNLQVLIDILCHLEACIRHVIQSHDNSIRMVQMTSLPTKTLQIIKCTFSHCKESNDLYSSVFDLVSELLATLFKRTYTVQKALMAYLDLVEVNDPEDCAVTAEVCQVFHNLCDIISSMDTTLMVATWKFLVKFISKHKTSITGDFDLSPMVKSLSSEIHSHFTHCLHQAPVLPTAMGNPSRPQDRKIFAKTLKICSLCSKMLVHMVKEFESVVEQCFECLLDLIMHVLSYSPPSIHTPDIEEYATNMLQGSLVGFVEPLLQCLVPHREFCQYLLDPKTETKSNYQFGRLLILTHVLKILPQQDERIHIRYHALDVRSYDASRLPILKSIFVTISECYTSFSKPVYTSGIAHNDKSQKPVSLYESVVSSICGYIATLSTEHFTAVERCLLEAVLGQSTWCVLVAMDVWCFIARFGTADLCASYCSTFANLISSLPNNMVPAYTQLCILLQRLIPLMAADSQEEFVQSFPFEDYPQLYEVIPLTALDAGLKMRVCTDICARCSNIILHWAKEGAVKDFAVKELIEALKLLHIILQSNCADLTIDDQLCDAIVKIFEMLPEDDPMVYPLTSPLIECAGSLLTKFSAQSLRQVLSRILDVINSNPSLQTRHACIHVLRGFGSIHITNHQMEHEIIHLMSSIFAALLQDGSLVIQNLSMEAFSSFAEETVHESVVPECLKDEDTQSRVVTFLNQVPMEVQNSTKPEIEILHEQHQAMTKESWWNLPAVKHECGESISNEPCSKKMKPDFTALRDVLEELHKNTQRLQTLINDVGKPPWLNMEIEKVISELKTIESEKT